MRAIEYARRKGYVVGVVVFLATASAMKAIASGPRYATGHLRHRGMEDALPTA